MQIVNRTQFNPTLFSRVCAVLSIYPCSSAERERFAHPGGAAEDG